MMAASLSTFVAARSALPPAAFSARVLRQQLLRLAALARLFGPPAPLHRSIVLASASLSSSPPVDWPYHVSALHAAGLAHVASLQGGCAGGGSELPAADALLGALAVLGLASGEAASACGSGTAPPISAALDLGSLLREEVGDVRALAVEKFGAAPPVELRLPPLGPCVGAPALLRHALAELLKNAISAQVAAFSAGGVEDAPPIEVALEAAPCGGLLRVAVRNFAGGRAQPPPPSLLRERGPFPFFVSAPRATGEREPTYHYSRDFGVRFSGAGVGLPRAFCYGALHGGGLALRAVAGGGVEAQLSLRRDGGGEGARPHPLLL